MSNPRDRSKWAWGEVSKVVGQDYSGRYSALVQKLPDMLRASGLGQTLAFLYSKSTSTSGQPHRQILVQLAQPLIGDRKDPAYELLGAIINAEPAQYRLWTEEIQERAEWLKRFAKGMIEAEEVDVLKGDD